MGQLCSKCTSNNVSSLAAIISKEFPTLKGDSAQAAALAILAASSNGVNAINYNRVPSKLVSTANLSPINTYEVQVALQPKTLVDRMNAMQIPNLIAVQPKIISSNGSQGQSVLTFGGEITGKDPDKTLTLQGKSVPANGQKGPDAEGNVTEATISADSRILGFRLEVQRVDLLKGPNTLSVRVEHAGTVVIDCSYTMTNPNTTGQLVALMAMPEQIATAMWSDSSVLVKTESDARRWQIDIPQAKTIKISVGVDNLQARIYPVIVCRDTYNKFVQAIVSGNLPELPAAFLE